jgi:hypothetical protein
VAHVELSLSESFVPQPRVADDPTASDAATADPATGGADPADDTALSPVGSVLDRWIVAVAHANEPCLVIDADATIIAASHPCYALLGMGTPGTAVGRSLLDGVLRLVDFTAARDELTETDIDKIPPLLALSSGRLARGLMRVHDGEDFDATVDAIATPLCDGPSAIGSLTFFSPI